MSSDDVIVVLDDLSRDVKERRRAMKQLLEAVSALSGYVAERLRNGDDITLESEGQTHIIAVREFVIKGGASAGRSCRVLTIDDAILGTRHPEWIAGIPFASLDLNLWFSENVVEIITLFSKMVAQQAKELKERFVFTQQITKNVVSGG